MDAKTWKPKQFTANAIFVVFAHVVSLLTVLFYPANRATLWLCFVIWNCAQIGITMGYHRLWSHKSYHASTLLRGILAFWGTVAFQGSIQWWVHRHRLHHRFTDTENDPYNSKRGFYFSHIGWIMYLPKYSKFKSIDMTDLKNDKIVQFQHKYYVPLALLCGMVMPTLIASLWGDALGGFLYGGYVVRIIIWHCTFSINSFAHWIGEQHFSLQSTARGGTLLALATHGEGYHNFHHAFPFDYRNGIHHLDYDPTKWCINLAQFLGIASNLKRANPKDIKKSKFDVIEQTIIETKPEFDWGPLDDDLPIMKSSDLKETHIILNDYVLDISTFMNEHPGGSNWFKIYKNKCIDDAFYHKINAHSRAAIMKATTLRVGRFVSMKEE